MKTVNVITVIVLWFLSRVCHIDWLACTFNVYGHHISSMLYLATGVDAAVLLDVACFLAASDFAVVV